MRMIRLKPKNGSTILNPDRDNRVLRAEGELVPYSVYWQRMLNNGDVVIATEPQRKAAARSAPETKAATAAKPKP